jgi:hypothetical protein
VKELRARSKPRVTSFGIPAPVWRPALSFGLAIAGAIALVPAFLLVAPASRWDHTGLEVALGAIALASYFAALILKRPMVLDSVFLVALLAVVFLGPAPAACIWIGTELVAWIVERHRLGAFAASVASYGWSALAASLLLEAIASGWPGEPVGVLGYLAVVAAALTMLFVNFLIVAGLVLLVRRSRRVWRTITRELRSQALAIILLPIAAAAGALLVAEAGAAAFVAVALLVLTPQVTLRLALGRATVHELPHRQAVALYCEAIASVMKLSSRDRLVLKDAAPFMRDRRSAALGGDVSQSGSGHRIALAETVLFSREHWDGCGGRPGALGGEMIPLTSRVIGVADAWAGLTCKDSPRLTHSQALLQLEARAGMHFDPRVVAAAAHVVRQERMGRLTDLPYQPRLHRIRMPLIGRAVRALSPLWKPREAERAPGIRRGVHGARHPLHEAPRL